MRGGPLGAGRGAGAARGFAGARVRGAAAARVGFGGFPANFGKLSISTISPINAPMARPPVSSCDVDTFDADPGRYGVPVDTTGAPGVPPLLQA